MPLYQIMVVRGVLASAVIALLAHRMGALRLRMSPQDALMVLLRAIAETASAYFFLTALMFLPLANLTAIMQLTPLAVTLGGALFFAEKVGWRRWSAIAAGFAGMLLIVKPGAEAFNTYSVYGLITVLCVAVRDLATRRMSGAVPTLTVTFCSSVMVLLFATVWSIGRDLAPVDGVTALGLAGTAVFITGGYLFSVAVMRVGEVSFVAPFRYTALLWAILMGFLFFGNFPDGLTLLGSGLVVASGIFTLWRERRMKKRQLPPRV